MAIYLTNCNDFPIKAKYRVPILDSSSKKTNTYASRVQLFGRSNSNASSWGRSSWVSKQSIIDNASLLLEGYLTIFCVLTVSEHFGKLFNNKEFSDVEIECEGEIFNCHMNILSTRSDVFRCMFQADMAEKRSNKVTIRDVDTGVVREMLNFIYTGCTNGDVFKEKSRELLAAAERFQLDVLKSLCKDHLCSNLQSNNAIENLVFGDFHQASKLRRMATNLIAKNVVKLVKTEKYQDLMKHHASLAAEIPIALDEDKMIEE